MVNKQKVHDGLVQRVANLMYDKGYCVIMQNPYICKNGACGEYDLLAINENGQGIVFEMKSSHTRGGHKKGVYQLNRDIKYINECMNLVSIRKMLVYYDKRNNIKYEWIRR